MESFVKDSLLEFNMACEKNAMHANRRACAVGTILDKIIVTLDSKNMDGTRPGKDIK